MNQNRKTFDTIKRSVDILSSSAALIFLCPIILVTALAVRLKLGSPVLFKQQRPGRNGKIFTLYKFRSMLDVEESRGLVTNEQRMTTFGRWLRGTSMDELPSLINVIKGDMSIVGPRPLRVEYLSRYSPTQKRRHDVRPGITGLAQVSGRNNISWEQRFELDVEYVDQRCAKLDTRIVMETLFAVLRRDGIEGGGNATMSAFVGSYPEDGLQEKPLNEDWLDTRVNWLLHPAIRNGITIDFEPDRATTKTWYEKIKTSSERRDWVFIDALGEPVAMAGLSGVGGTDIELYLYVNPDMQGRGHGASVLRRLILNARSSGAKKLILEVKETNVSAIRLYEKNGFIMAETITVNSIQKRKYIFDLKE